MLKGLSGNLLKTLSFTETANYEEKIFLFGTHFPKNMLASLANGLCGFGIEGQNMGSGN